MRCPSHIRIRANCIRAIAIGFYQCHLSPSTCIQFIALWCILNNAVLFHISAFFMRRFCVRVIVRERARTCMVNELQHQLNVFIHFHVYLHTHTYARTHSVWVTIYFDNARWTVRPMCDTSLFLALFCGRLMTFLADTSRHRL